MVSRFQFEAVEKLIDSGVTNYVQIRSQVGLTSSELNDILENVEYYHNYFEQQDRLAAAEAARTEKKPWWKRGR